MKKLIFLIALFFAAMPFPALALELQMHWPTLTLPGIGTFNIETATRLHDVARYIYYGFVILGGIVGFIGLVIGGIRWLTSTGNLAAISKAKKQIWASFVGLLIILFSWLILYTIDPDLVIFHNFPEVVAIPPIEGKPKAELTDGIIFTVENHPLLTKIEVPGGLIHVEDTRRFPVGDTYVNLSGRTADGQVINPITRQTRIPWVSEIEIRRHFTSDERYQYGVACFEDPYFRGSVRLFIPPLRNCPAILNPHPAPANRVDFVICRQDLGIFGNEHLPCGSILVFKIDLGQAGFDLGSALSTFFTDNDVVFYQYPFSEREKKNPITLKKEIVGECIRMDSLNPDDPCEVRQTFYTWINFLDSDSIFSLMNNVCGNLRGSPAPGQFWYPRSMELPKEEGAAKYIVFLFQTDMDHGLTGDGRHHWHRGDAYWFESDVNDFYNEKGKDKRLYWTHLPFAGKEDLSPKSCIIIPIKTVY